MTAPPGIARRTEPPGERITGERETDLSTRSGQERYLVHSLGLTYPQAKELLRAYERDMERPLATVHQDYKPSFLDWLMRQAPGGRRRTVRKFQVGEAGWRTRS